MRGAPEYPPNPGAFAMAGAGLSCLATGAGQCSPVPSSVSGEWGTVGQAEWWFTAPQEVLSH